MSRSDDQIESRRECSPADLVAIAESLKSREGFIVLLDIACVDCGSFSKSRFRLVYRLLNMERHERLALSLSVGEATPIETLSPLWSNAACYEMEIADLFGIKFSSPYPRRFTGGRMEGFPLRKDFSPKVVASPRIDDDGRQGGAWYPTEPEGKGAMLFRLEMEGEVIRHSTAVPGYAHKGLEKMFESIPYHGIIPFIERMNLTCAVANSLAWAKAVEKLCAITISDRAAALRMVFLELSRIYSHLFCLSTMMIRFGFSALEKPFKGMRREVGGLMDGYGGGDRAFPGIAEIGGICDVGPPWILRCLNTLKNIGNYLGFIEAIGTKNADWMSRIDHFRIDPAFSLQWGYCGPLLRSCGLNYDLRKVSPYYFYGDVDFDIPLGIDGTGYDCYLVKVEEVRQSCKIVAQVIDNLPEGKTMDTNLSFRFREGRSKDEFYRYVVDGIKTHGGEVYSFVEGPAGEVGFYILDKGDNRPYRVKMRSPHYPVLFSLDELFKSKTLLEADDMLYSFNLSMSEIDR